MKNEADIIVKLRQSAKVGDNLLAALEELANAMDQNPNLPNTAIVIRRTKNYLELLETNARMAEAFQSIMTLVMEEGIFIPSLKGATKH